MPTPARRAISSSEASVPWSANTSRAAVSSASKLRRASARCGRRAARPGIGELSATTPTPFRGTTCNRRLPSANLEERLHFDLHGSPELQCTAAPPGSQRASSDRSVLVPRTLHAFCTSLSARRARRPGGRRGLLLPAPVAGRAGAADHPARTAHVHLCCHLGADGVAAVGRRRPPAARPGG